MDGSSDEKSFMKNDHGVSLAFCNRTSIAVGEGHNKQEMEDE